MIQPGGSYPFLYLFGLSHPGFLPFCFSKQLLSVYFVSDLSHASWRFTSRYHDQDTSHKAVLALEKSKQSKFTVKDYV